MEKTNLFILLLLCCYACLIKCDYILNVPYEHYYLPSNMSRSYKVNGCQINEWNGTCAVGLFGYQYVTTINCTDNNMYQMKGINNFGELNMINILGKEIKFEVNDSGTITNDILSSIGDYVWFSPGLIININITGSVYIFGGKTTLTPINNMNNISSASHVYRTLPYRTYKILDGNLIHDPHIDNGSSYAFDVIYSTTYNVDPPYVMVINCENNTRVLNHFHPWNALYLPLTNGKVYYINEYYNKTLGYAITGYPRWVSATLRYNELLETNINTNPNVNKLIKQLNIDENKCANPLMFAVTNFDANVPNGKPNFDDKINDTMEITPTRMISIVVAH